MSQPSVNIEELSPQERLDLIERLWESLRRSPETLPLTDAQRAELDRRLDNLEREGAVGIPWEEVLRRIKGNPGRGRRSFGLQLRRT